MGRFVAILSNSWLNCASGLRNVFSKFLSPLLFPLLKGDQNEPKIFDFFLENNVMAYLHRVLQQPANRTGDVAKQVLQTLGMIIQVSSAQVPHWCPALGDSVLQ